MSLYHLSASDFVIMRNEDNINLCTEINGISVVLFYSPACVHCNRVAIPLIKSMPNVLRGCIYGMINVSTNKQLIDSSQNSTTPIKFVPFFVLYYNGMPYAIFNSSHDVNTLTNFIKEVAEHIRQESKNNSYVSQNSQIKYNKNRKSRIISYGTPLYGDDDKTYLEFLPAYKN